MECVFLQYVSTYFILFYVITVDNKCPLFLVKIK